MSSRPVNPFEENEEKEPPKDGAGQTWLQKVKQNKLKSQESSIATATSDQTRPVPAAEPSRLASDMNTSSTAAPPPKPKKERSVSPTPSSSENLSNTQVTMTGGSPLDDKTSDRGRSPNLGSDPVAKPAPPPPPSRQPSDRNVVKMQNPINVNHTTTTTTSEPSNSFRLKKPESSNLERSNHNEDGTDSLPSIDMTYSDPEKNDSTYTPVMTRSPIHSQRKAKEIDKMPKSYVNLKVEPGNPIYSKNTYSQGYMLTALACHIGQFAILLTVGQRTLPDGALYFLLVLVIIVALLLIYSRFCVHRKERKFELWSKEPIQPDDETDEIPAKAIYAMVAAVLIEGFTFAIYAVLTSGTIGTLDKTGFFTSDTTLQALRFASITLLALYRIIRPANRVDPMRTFMELEVVSVCWDALDGSTIVELVDGRNLSPNTLLASQFLIIFWYISVGVRMAVMISILLPPSDLGYRLVAYQPLQMAEQPTIDRTMQGLRVRSNLILVMAFAEFYAAGLRIMLWIQGSLDSLQQDMAIKNILFLSSVYTAYSFRNNTIKRDWNDRDLGFGILLPTRPVQLRIFRWIFVIAYLTQGVLMSVILTQVSSSSNPWAVNVASDVLFVVIFLLYCSHTHIQNPDTSRYRFLLPRKSYVMFPAKMALIVSTLMMINLYAARIPAIYYRAKDMSGDNTGSLVNYNSALLIVNMSIITIGSMSMYWSVAFMLFKKEFTASPGK
jgi:hypothetical protein